MKLNREKILQTLQKDEDLLERLTAVIKKSNEKSDYFSWYDDFDTLDEAINLLESENDLNCSLMKDESCDDFEVHLTTFQRIGESEKQRTIIWVYDIDLYFQDLDDFINFVARNHNEIEKDFKL